MVAITVHSDLGVQENKICHASTFSPSICPEVMVQDAMILVFFNVETTLKQASFFTLLFHIYQEAL